MIAQVPQRDLSWGEQLDGHLVTEGTPETAPSKGVRVASRFELICGRIRVDMVIYGFRA